MRPKKKRRHATIYVHLTDHVLCGQVDGVARVDALGPMLLEQVADLVEHREVTVGPVIDLDSAHSVNGCEHPTAVKLRTRLRTVSDVCQLGLGAYRWVAPHGLARVVTPRGTRKVELLRARDGTIAGEIYLGTGLDSAPRS